MSTQNYLLFFKYWCASLLSFVCFIIAPSFAQEATNPTKLPKNFNIVTYKGAQLQNSTLSHRALFFGGLDLNNTSMLNSEGQEFSVEFLQASRAMILRDKRYDAKPWLAKSRIFNSDELTRALVKVDNSGNFPQQKSEIRAQLLMASRAMRDFEPAGDMEVEGQTIILNAECDEEFEVYTIRARVLNTADAIHYPCDSAGPDIIINVKGRDVNLSGIDMTQLAPLADKVIFNFHRARAINVSNQVLNGSILSPYAKITSSGSEFNGRIFTRAIAGDLSINNVDLNVRLKKIHNAQVGELDCTSAVANKPRLTPGGNRFEKVKVRGVASSAAKPSITIQCITQDEPLKTKNDGSPRYTAKDISHRRAKLNKKLNSGENGRVYTISFLAELGEQRCEGSVKVEVAHDLTSTVVDDGGAVVAHQDPLACAGANTPPQIISEPPVQVSAGDEYQYQVEASDQEGDALSYTVESPPNNGVQVNGDGLVSWLPNASSPDLQDINITVSDGVLSSTQSYACNVEQENRPPYFVSEPILDAMPNALYLYQVEAIDPDNDMIAYILDVGPEGMSLDSTQLLSWTPRPDQVGVHRVSIIVCDTAGLIDTQSFDITVAAQNRPPMIISTAPTQAFNFTPFVYDVAATDPDGDPLNFTVEQGPNGMSLVPDPNDPYRARLEWLATTQGGLLVPVEIKVTDPGDLSDAQGFEIVVQGR